MESQNDFKALWDISYGLYVVTSFSGNKMNGQIANTVFQVSSQPPKIAVSINKTNLTHEYIKTSGALSVSILEQDTPMPFIGLFGFKSGRDTDKLAEVNFKTGTTGCPIVMDHTLSVFEGTVIESADAGTHSIFVVELSSAEVLKKGIPMTYAYYQKVKKGKAPSTAPTYKGNQTAAQETAEKSSKEDNMEKYVCSVCGYVYDPEAGDPDNGIDPGTSFKNLPDDWTCPVCGAAKDEFEPE